MSLQQVIEQAFENRNEYSPATMPQDVRDAINQVLEQLDMAACAWRRKKMASGSLINGPKKRFYYRFV